MRKTSAKAYSEISDQLSHMRATVFEALVKHGPGTAGEINQWLNDQGISVIRNNTNKRLGELRDLHVVSEQPENRPCSVSGRVAIVWEPTGTGPVAEEVTRTCWFCRWWSGGKQGTCSVPVPPWILTPRSRMSCMEIMDCPCWKQARGTR